MDTLKIKNNIINKHPFISAGVLCVIFYLFTGGTVEVMGAIKTCCFLVSVTAIIVYYLVSSIEKSALHVLWSIPLGAIAGFVCNTVTNPQVFILAYGIGLIIISVVLLAVTHKMTWDKMVTLLIFAGILLRIYRCLTSSVSGMDQHDVSYFKFNMDEAAHDNYILWFYKYWSLPDFDVRLNGQFYHPPLHYFISALLLKINSIIFPSLSENYECLQTLSLFYSSVVLIITRKVLSLFDVKGRGLFFSLMIVAFYPGMILLSGSINNDSIAIMFTVLAIYLALKWYREPSMKYIIFVAMAIGFGMMSKISCGLLAFPVGLMFLVKFIKDNSKKKRFFEFIAFAILVFPLGMWFPVRNYILHKVPFTYVHNIGLPADMDLSAFSLTSRLFDFSGGSVSVPFMVYSENMKEYNIFVSLFKTSLFDDYQLNHNQLFLGIGSVIYLVGTVFMVMLLALFIYYVVILIKDKKYIGEGIGILVLFLAELISICSFAMKYPVTCSTNFRYIAPVVLSVAVIYGVTHKKITEESRIGILSKVMDGITSLFLILSMIFTIGAYFVL